MSVNSGEGGAEEDGRERIRWIVQRKVLEVSGRRRVSGFPKAAELA